MHISGLRTRATLSRVQQFARCFSDSRLFAPGDRVLLRNNKDRSAAPILTAPLTPGKYIETHRGNIHHADIIGKRARDLVRSSMPRANKPGVEYRVHEVTLEEYVRLSRRIVTPVYPADAAVIVDLLDLHPEALHPPSTTDTTPPPPPRIEILEAGTGHGALTCYLSRAVHAANLPPPPPSDPSSSPDDPDALTEWKARRGAVVHTIDVSARHTAHAAKTVHGFRNGLYARNVDFHTGDVGQWLEDELAARTGRAREESRVGEVTEAVVGEGQKEGREERGEEEESKKERQETPFLSHAVLDLPNAHEQLARVARALRVDGAVVVFNPSITQITACATHVKERRIPLDLEKVVELGLNGASGGREWDVRFAVVRGGRPAGEQERGGEGDGDDVVAGAEDAPAAETLESVESADKWSLVCRPKVGERITGGGFLGVWRKRGD